MQPIQSIEGCGPRALGHGGVIEDVMDKVLDRSSEGEDRLADVNQLCRAGPNDMDAQQYVRLSMKHHSLKGPW